MLSRSQHVTQQSYDSSRRRNEAFHTFLVYVCVHYNSAMSCTNLGICIEQRETKLSAKLRSVASDCTRSARCTQFCHKFRSVALSCTLLRSCISSKITERKDLRSVSPMVGRCARLRRICALTATAAQLCYDAAT